MTTNAAKNKLRAWAASQLGYAEGGDNYNKYAQGKYDAYGWDVQNQPWCDVFVDAGFIECFGLEAASRMTYQPRGGFSALCSASAQYYKNNGAWYTSPEIGDQIFFYNSGGINHTGIVTDVKDGYVSTIEGNSSDIVARRSYVIGSPQIAGYGRPKWSVVARENAGEETEAADEAQAQETPAESYCPYVYTVRVNLLKIGSYGPQVKRVQQLLAANGFDPGEITGKFDEATKKALIAFQTAAGIGVDGEWGGESFTALWNYAQEADGHV